MTVNVGRRFARESAQIAILMWAESALVARQSVQAASRADLDHGRVVPAHRTPDLLRAATLEQVSSGLAA